MDDFGALLDYFCQRQGITLKALAIHMSVHRNTIDNWKARGKPPKKEAAAKLAKILNLDEEETNRLLTSAGYAPKYALKESMTPSSRMSKTERSMGQFADTARRGIIERCRQ